MVKPTLRHSLATLLLGASLAAPLARGQSAQQYEHAFSIPPAASCEVDLVGVSSGANIATFEGYNTDGNALATTATRDIGAAKASRVKVGELFPEYPSTIKVTSTAPSDANITCEKEIGRQFAWWMPWAPPWMWSFQTVPVLTSYTQQSFEFPTTALTAVKESPAKVFQPVRTATEEVPASERWTNNIFAAYLGNNNAATVQFSTPQLDPTKTSPAGHNVQRNVARDGTIQDSVQNIFTPQVLQNSGDVTVKLQQGAVNSMQLFQSGAGNWLPLELNKEQASPKLSFPYVFVSGAEATWADDALSLTNPNPRTATVYLRPYDASGAAMDFTVVEVPAGQTLTKRTYDLFKDVRGKENIASVEASSQGTTPILGTNILKFGSDMVPVRAGTTLDTGRHLVHPRAVATSDSVSIYAILNPGTRTENGRMTAIDASGKPLAQQAFTLKAHEKLTGSIEGLLGVPRESLSTVAYVTVDTTSAAPTVFNPYSSTGNLTAVALNISYPIGRLHFEGGTPLTNADPLRMNLFSETYSPNANKELPKFNGGPHTLTATVIGNDPVQELTYNPRGDDDLTKGYSARLPNSSFSRMLHTTASTVNGPVQSELPLSTGNYITKEYTGVFQPKITITTPVEKVSLRTPLNVLVERDVSPDDIAIGGYGPGTARQIIAENPAGIAQIFYDNRGAFALSNDVNRSYGGWLFFFNDKGTSGSQGELKTLTLIDHTRNRVSYTSANSAPGTFFAIDILPTPAGESFIDQLKSYFRVPNDVENKQWVHKPGTYQK